MPLAAPVDQGRGQGVAVGVGVVGEHPGRGDGQRGVFGGGVGVGDRGRGVVVGAVTVMVTVADVAAAGPSETV